MLLKHIMPDARIGVQHEPARPRVPALPGRPDPGPAGRTETEPGRTGGEVRPAPDVYRIRRARGAERVNPQPPADRSRAPGVGRRLACWDRLTVCDRFSCPGAQRLSA